MIPLAQYGAGTNIRNRNFGESLGFLNINTRTDGRTRPQKLKKSRSDRRIFFGPTGIFLERGKRLCVLTTTQPKKKQQKTNRKTTKKAESTKSRKYIERLLTGHT